jgi:hypothetical protein
MSASVGRLTSWSRFFPETVDYQQVSILDRNWHHDVEFYQSAKTIGLKPVIGIEAYLAPESRYHKKPVLWSRAGGERDWSAESVPTQTVSSSTGMVTT